MTWRHKKVACIWKATVATSSKSNLSVKTKGCFGQLAIFTTLSNTKLIYMLTTFGSFQASKHYLRIYRSCRELPANQHLHVSQELKAWSCSPKHSFPTLKKKSYFIFKFLSNSKYPNIDAATMPASQELRNRVTQECLQVQDGDILFWSGILGFKMTFPYSGVQHTIFLSTLARLKFQVSVIVLYNQKGDGCLL